MLVLLVDSLLEEAVIVERFIRCLVRNRNRIFVPGRSYHIIKPKSPLLYLIDIPFLILLVLPEDHPPLHILTALAIDPLA